MIKGIVIEVKVSRIPFNYQKTAVLFGHEKGRIQAIVWFMNVDTMPFTYKNVCPIKIGSR